MSSSVGQQLAARSAQATLKLESGLRSSTGVRSENQDRAAQHPMRDGLYGIVADGMGGGVDGQLFSRQAVDTIIEALDQRTDTALAERITLALQDAVAASYTLRASDPRYQQSGTTLAMVGAVVQPSSCRCDCRTYRR